MIAGINEQETIELCAQYGIKDYILKPSQFDRFQKVSYVLNRKKSY